MSKYPFYKQLDAKDCGPSCLRMVSKYYGKIASLEYLREICYINKYGTSMLSLHDGAETLGFKTLGVKINYEELLEKITQPCIILYNYEHYIVVYKISDKYVWVGDPSKRSIEKLDKENFESRWYIADTDKGYALIVEKSLDFEKSITDSKNKTLFYFKKYLNPHKKELYQLLVGILFFMILSFIFPFVSQAVIDIGINNQNLDFIKLIIIAQIILVFSSTAVSLIQDWIKLHIGVKMSVSMLSDYILKLLKLPISFFQNRTIGDILQRMNDNRRVLAFVTGTPLSIIISLITLVIYGIIMMFYSIPIIIIFVIGNIFYGIWLFVFLKKRRELDYEGFDLNSKDESKTLELINGIQDIKLNNLQREKRWEWEDIKSEQYELSKRGLRLAQTQGTGAMLINRSKDIIISYIAAKSVIDGDITLGMMFAIQYMIGQLQQPFNTFIGLIHSIQDFKISLERLSEVVEKDDEEDESLTATPFPMGKSIRFENIDFRYEGKSSDLILNNLNFIIPENKITAIIGRSGSGKTTLLKLLAKLYGPTGGDIFIDRTNLNTIKNKPWRNTCGIVMQDGFLFNDSILNNIILKDEYEDMKRFNHICEIVNIDEFVNRLPMKYKTIIGSDNVKISEGQKQRILLARAFYKSPSYLFLDEVTSNLDNQNEMKIMQALIEYKHNTTIIISAHRLSTIMNADNILVLDNGSIIQEGTHHDLIKETDGFYYKLVSQKLDL